MIRERSRPPAAEERRVGGVDDGVDGQRGDVGADGAKDCGHV